MQGTNTNTILIVILILVVVGFGAYWYNNANSKADTENNPGLQINLGGDAKSGDAQ